MASEAVNSSETRYRKTRVGIVTSNKMDKTVTVTIERRVANKEFKKSIRRQSQIKAHDEKNECQIGDRVQVVECRPLSKTKRWRVQKMIERSV